MRVLCFPLVLLIVTSSAWEVEAGILRRTPKPKAEDRVPELIEILKSSADDHKRADAAAELGQYDPKIFAEIIPALTDSLRNDTNSTVRRESAKSIGELRPYFPQAGYALELAAQNDPAFFVRTAATTSLNIYYFLGYRSAKSNEAPPMQTQEPPLAAPLKNISVPVVIAPTKSKPMNLPPILPAKSPPRPTPPLMMTRGIQTVEPPLSIPVPAPALRPIVKEAPPLETDVKEMPKPPADPKDEGPSLTPPK